MLCGCGEEKKNSSSMSNAKRIRIQQCSNFLRNDKVQRKCYRRVFFMFKVYISRKWIDIDKSTSRLNCTMTIFYLFNLHLTSTFPILVVKWTRKNKKLMMMWLHSTFDVDDE